MADLLDETTVTHRHDLGTITVTIGHDRALGSFVTIQTIAGFSIVSEHDAPAKTDFDGEDIAIAIMTLRGAYRSALMASAP